MGGSGSGRKGFKKLTSNLWHLDIRTLKHSGFLKHMANFSWEWDNSPMAVKIDWTECHIGGYRPWFLCPLCGRRCSKLYAGKRFYCRVCLNLAYPSENETDLDRLFRKTRKIRKRLKSSIDLTRPVLKPKNMHSCTYRRLSQKAFQVEKKIWSEMASKLSTLNDHVL